MNLYNEEIDRLIKITNSLQKARVLEDKTPWPLLKRDEIVLKSEQGLELGGEGNVGVSGIGVTFDEGLVQDSGVFVYGRELCDFSSDDRINYARIIIVRLNNNEVLLKDPNRLYGHIKKIDYLKYHLIPEGFSIRISSIASKETVRVKKDSLKRGISFKSVGEALLEEYLQVESVAACRVIFASSTGDGEAFEKIRDIARRCDSITESLNTIYDGLVMDCNICGQKSLCDEIDGIRQFHISASKTSTTH